MQSQEVLTFGELPDGDWKWHGGVLAGDGCIYAFPAHAETVLKIDCCSGEVKQIGGNLQGRYSFVNASMEYLPGITYCLYTSGTSGLADVLEAMAAFMESQVTLRPY